MGLTRRKYARGYVFHRVVLTKEVFISLDKREVLIEDLAWPCDSSHLRAGSGRRKLLIPDRT